MAEDASWSTGRHIAFENVQIGAADGRLHDFDDCVGWGCDVRPWTFLKSFLSRSEVDERLHDTLLRLKISIGQACASLWVDQSVGIRGWGNPAVSNASCFDPAPTFMCAAGHGGAHPLAARYPLQPSAIRSKRKH
jgi:hypothetical protein